MLQVYINFSTDLLFSIFYLLFAICYLLFAVCNLLFGIWYLLFAICYLLFAFCYLLSICYLFAICYLLFAMHKTARAKAVAKGGRGMSVYRKLSSAHADVYIS